MNARYVAFWTAATITMAMGVALAGGEATTSPDRDPLSTKVQLSKVEGGDIVQAFSEIIAQTPAFSFEILRTPQDVKPYRAEGFTLAEGEYTISQILEGIRSKTAAVTWETIDDHVYVRIRVSKDFQNPMDMEVTDSLKGTFTRMEIMGWLNEKVPDLRLLFTDTRLSKMPWPKREILIERGTKVREVITRVGMAWGVGWGAEVYLQPGEAQTMGPTPAGTKPSRWERIKLVFGKGMHFAEEATEKSGNKSP